MPVRTSDLLSFNPHLISFSVIEEAGSSKYKNALHSKAFDSAVKKYRIRENKQTEKIAARSRPEIPRARSDGSLIEAVDAAHVTAQQELERLPHEILKQARTFNSHMQYFANNTETNWDEPSNPPSSKRSRTPKELYLLLDEIAKLEEIGERTKRDIMEDDAARNVSYLNGYL